MKRFSSIRHGTPATIHAALQAKERLQPRVTPLPVSQSQRYYLKPGELYVGEETALVETVLGSCVAIAMFSPRNLLGSLSHSMLPTDGNAKFRAANCLEGARFVDCSIHCMLDWFLQRGVLRKEIVVKVFGGSAMFPGPESYGRIGVGRQNIERALQVIEQEKLYLAAFDLGGLGGRKIYFKTNTGEIFLKRLHRSELTK